MSRLFGLGGNTRTAVAAIVFFFMGLMVGWLALGLWLFPVQYYDTYPQDLRRNYKEDYIRLVADAYSLNQDPARAQERLSGFDPSEVSEIIDLLIARGETQGDLPAVQRLRNLATALGAPPAGETPVAQATSSPFAKPTPALVPNPLLQNLPLGIMLFLVVFLSVSSLAFLLTRARKSSWEGIPLSSPPILSEEAPAPTPEPEQELPRVAPPGHTLGRFRASYRLGEEDFDLSFNIETPAGEFYGACGISYSELLGRNPDRITAFEVWLFDRTDPQNVQNLTKLLMSEYSYQNPPLKEKMRNRGEPVLVAPGLGFSVSGVGIELTAKVVEFAYGTSPDLPENAYFEALTLELIPNLKNR